MGENTIFLQGERIDLLVKNIDNIKIYHKWVNNPDIRTYLSMEVPESLEVIKKDWFPDYRNTENIWFEIWHKEDQIPIGMVGLIKINYIYRHAELGIFIGESEYWGKGIGTEAVNLILKYAFDTLSFHKIAVSINVNNTKSLKMLKKIGFIEEGHLKEVELINGKWTDVKWLGLLKKDRKD
ncbi:MAG: GNAT family N-acetyltransferase [Candidatus Hodarchaeota archaeon]